MSLLLQFMSKNPAAKLQRLNKIVALNPLAKHNRSHSWWQFTFRASHSSFTQAPLPLMLINHRSILLKAAASAKTADPVTCHSTWIACVNTVVSTGRNRCSDWRLNAEKRNRSTVFRPSSLDSAFILITRRLGQLIYAQNPSERDLKVKKLVKFRNFVKKIFLFQTVGNRVKPEKDYQYANPCRNWLLSVKC